MHGARRSPDRYPHLEHDLFQFVRLRSYKVIPVSVTTRVYYDSMRLSLAMGTA